MTKKMIKMLSVNLPVLILKEGKSFIAYTPALDLSTCGGTEKEAKKMFGEALEIFLEELNEAGTLEEVFWKPPVVVKCDSQKISIPVAA